MILFLGLQLSVAACSPDLLQCLNAHRWNESTSETCNERTKGVQGDNGLPLPCDTPSAQSDAAPRRAAGCDGDGRGPRTPAPAFPRVAALSTKPQSQHGRGNGDLGRGNGDLVRRPRQARAAPRAGRGREGGRNRRRNARFRSESTKRRCVAARPVARPLARRDSGRPGPVGVAIADSVLCIAGQSLPRPREGGHGRS